MTSAIRSTLVTAALGLAAMGAARAQAGTTAPADSALPAARRPVARIVSTAWDTEARRDGVGEAERVFALLALAPDARVADIGAGAGYYTTRLARRLSPGGMVYAQDINQKILDRLGARLARERLGRVTLVLGEPNDPKLPRASVDLALLSHMYHEIARPYDFLFNLYPALAPGGRIAVIDSDKPTESHGTPPAVLRCEMAALGYREVSFHRLEPAVGYLAVFAAPDTLPAPSSVVACAA
ncbi:MAG: class I SAM-dependent methyltransferase [Gemmatimonadales bacterium]